MNNPDINSERQNGAAKAGAGDGSAALDVGQSLPSPFDSKDMSEEDWAKFQQNIPIDEPKVNGIVVKDYDWKSDLLKIWQKDKTSGRYIEIPDPKCQKNIYLMTRYAESLRGIFILNEFSGRKMVVECPPWENQQKFRARDVRDDDYTRVCMELETIGMKPSVDKVVGAIESICHDRSFHPVQRYFSKLKWDETPRLKTWLSYYLGAESDDAKYLEGVGTKWLVAGVARIMQPGCKFDHMMVLEGLTDIGKSEVFRKMATFNGVPYFFDGMTFAKISDKDTMQNLQGFLIIEFPEMSSMHSREVEEIKQWITIQEDRGRKPYGREPVVFRRQFILGGSTNNEQYLKDHTGNKRFWPVMCGKIDLKSLEADREQLWAEAVHLYKKGYKFWIPEGDALIGLSRHEQKKRLITHPWEDAILDYLDNKDSAIVSRILMDVIGKKLESIKKADEMIVANILKSNGFMKDTNGKSRSWRRREMQSELNLERDTAC